MKDGLTVCISFFAENHWKISYWLWVFGLWTCRCSFIWSNLYLSLRHFVENPVMSAFTGWVGWVSSWLHVCWFNTFGSDLTHSKSRDFLFQFANRYSYKKSLREAKIIFLLLWFLSFFIFVLSFCPWFEITYMHWCIGCHIYIQKNTIKYSFDCIENENLLILGLHWEKSFWNCISLKHVKKGKKWLLKFHFLEMFAAFWN